MKTQIIQLEPHDDTLSVRDKMDWSQTPRVLLVWPEKSKVLRTRLDLILLERYSSSHGSQLAILTRDREVVFQAEEAGIPVFQSRREAQLQPWRKSFRDFQRQELEKYAAENLPEEPFERVEHQPRKRLPVWARIPIFTLGVLAVLMLAAFLLPSAEITVMPEIRQHSLSIPVQAQCSPLNGCGCNRSKTASVDGWAAVQWQNLKPGAVKCKSHRDIAPRFWSHDVPFLTPVHEGIHPRCSIRP